MIVGDKSRFAIEAEVDERKDGWVLGRLRFWLGSHAVGNWDDTVDLLGCMRWLREFASERRDRFEPALEALSGDQVFLLVYDPVIATGQARSSFREVVPESYSRFHVSHLGMSAFDEVDILLLVERDGTERCLWREGEAGEVHECRLADQEMESVAGKFVTLLEVETSSTTH